MDAEAKGLKPTYKPKPLRGHGQSMREPISKRSNTKRFRHQPENFISHTLDAVQGVYRAFAVGNIPEVLAVFAQDIQWTEAEGGPYGGAYRATGKSFRAPFAHVWKFKDGKAVSSHQYTDTVVHQWPLQD